MGCAVTLVSDLSLQLRHCSDYRSGIWPSQQPAASRPTPQTSRTPRPAWTWLTLIIKMTTVNSTWQLMCERWGYFDGRYLFRWRSSGMWRRVGSLILPRFRAKWGSYIFAYVLPETSVRIHRTRWHHIRPDRYLRFSLPVQQVGRFYCSTVVPRSTSWQVLTSGVTFHKAAIIV